MQRIVCTTCLVAFALAGNAKPKLALLSADLATESPFKLALESSISLIASASAPVALSAAGGDDADAAKAQAAKKHAEDYANAQRLKTEVDRLNEVAAHAKELAAQSAKLAQHHKEQMKARAAYKKAADIVAEDESKVAEMNMPVARAIPLLEMAKFIKTLSPECGKHFEKMMDDQNQHHVYGSGYVGATTVNCADLGGALCKTDAQTSVELPAPGLRSTEHITESFSTEGDSCLPRECVSETDLDNVAEFMQKQALAIIPRDKQVHVKLSLDCSKDGGSYATFGSGTALMAPTALVLAAAFVWQALLQ